MSDLDPRSHPVGPILTAPDLDIPGAIQQALGAASLCWDAVPTGEFDSIRAKAIGEELIHFITDRLNEVVDRSLDSSGLLRMIVGD